MNMEQEYIADEIVRFRDNKGRFVSKKDIGDNEIEEEDIYDNGR
jgi:hypothetical protein